MARTIREARIESPTARAKLKRGRQAHWRTVVPGRVALGYARSADAANGRWILRRVIEGSYRVEPLGLADDTREADGAGVLDFTQAQAKALALADAGEGKPSRSLTVRKAMADYIDFKASEGQDTKDAEQRIAARITPVLGDIPVADLTSGRIRRWLADLAASPARKRTKKGTEQKHLPTPEDEEAVRRRRSSANRVLVILKAALNHAYDEKRVANNEAWGRRVKAFRGVDAARIRYLTAPEAKRLVNASDPDFRKLVIAALSTGARYSELTRLMVGDFNPDTGTLHVRRSKSGKARHIVLNAEGIAFFEKVCVGRSGGERMFSRDDGEAWGTKHQARPMVEAVKRAKISPVISFHGLRHTYASLSVMAGMPLLVLAKNLGHADTRMVEKHYGHMSESHVAEAVRAHAPTYGIVKRKGNVVALRSKRA